MTTDEIDVRCGDCVQIGIECPWGYAESVWECVRCAHRFVWMHPGCATFDAPDCPECHGYCEEDEDAHD